jgi:uncharacterized Zn-binding protein involved in type VI secretion
MPGVIRKSVDTAGGKNSVGSPNVFVNNTSAVRVGDAIESHGRREHGNPIMGAGSATVFVNGIPLCRSGDVANCGHVAGPGSANVISG